MKPPLRAPACTAQQLSELASCATWVPSPLSCSPNPACTITLEAGTCEEAALLTVCKPYNDAVHDGRCAGLIESDGGPSSLVAPCFPDPAIADPNARRVALTVSLERLFCGP